MLVEMRQMSCKREEKYLLKDIDWQVKPGENWAIVGLNGSGKTTLLNIINGYMWPSSGRVRVLGKELGRVDIREIRPSIGWVSSSLQEKLYTHEAVEDIVVSGKYASIGLYERAGTADRERALSLLQEVGLRNLGGRRYDTLSQGEKQKVLIARALMSRPRLLLLDEPCSGLDIFSREQFLKAIEGLCRRAKGPNLLYVSHRVEEIIPGLTKVLLLRRGEVHSQGDAASVLITENLSDFFEIPVEVRWQDRRPWLIIRGDSSGR